MKRQCRVGSRLFMGLVFLFLYAPILLLVVFFGNFIQKQFVRRQTMLAAKASVAG